MSQKRSIPLCPIKPKAKVLAGAVWHGLKLANIDMNRKMLADLAVNDAEAFKAVVDEAKKALN